MLSFIDSKISQLEKTLGLHSQQSHNIEYLTMTQGELLPQALLDSTLFVGDNLIFLKYFAHRSPSIVDLCYIDPPYNTGNKFLYHDSRKSELSGPFGSHCEWMGFMLPRLVMARELLKKTGIIAVSIDDYEQVYLKVLMDHIFGEKNFIGNIVVCRSKNGKGSKRNIAPSHEYLLIYGKTSEAELIGQPDDHDSYNKADKYGHYKIDGLFRKKGEASLRTDRPNMFYPLYFDAQTNRVSVDPIPEWEMVFPIDSKGIERRWLWSRDTARERTWQLYASQKGVIYVKNYANNDKNKRTKVRTFWSDTSFYTERATNEMTKLFGTKVFDTPKPLEYIKAIINSMAPSDAIILDFFAGSGTTAHAAAMLNQVDMGNRKTILMETDSFIPEQHIAYGSGFKQISDITKARLEILRNQITGFSYEVFFAESKSKIDYNVKRN